MSTPKFVIVVGASAGGMRALSEFVGQLKSGMDVAVFIVRHLSRTSITDFLMPCNVHELSIIWCPDIRQA